MRKNDIDYADIAMAGLVVMHFATLFSFAS